MSVRRKLMVTPSNQREHSQKTAQKPAQLFRVQPSPTPTRVFTQGLACKQLALQAAKHTQAQFALVTRVRNSVSMIEIHEKKLILPFVPAGCKTIVFDLDETLIHCAERSGDENAEKSGCSRGAVPEVLVRPFAQRCLAEANKLFEVIVFTAGLPEYADPILDSLDPKHELIQHRLYRNNCVNARGMLVKDLRVFGNRDLKDIVIVDNCVYSFGNQLDNGVPIRSWLGNKDDRELLRLIELFGPLSRACDVRDVLRSRYKLNGLYSLHSTKQYRRSNTSLK